MDLVHSFDMRPIGLCYYLINIDFGKLSCSVLVYFSSFDPRLWPKGLLLMFEFDFQVEEAIALRRLIQVD
jgi:hypothetical protein